MTSYPLTSPSLSSTALSLFGLNKKESKEESLFTNWLSGQTPTPLFSSFNAFSGGSVSAQTTSDATSASAAALLWLGSTREAAPETALTTSGLLTYVSNLFDTKAADASQGNSALDWFFGAPASLDATEGQGADLFSYFQGRDFSAAQESVAPVEAPPAGGLFELVRFVKAGAEVLPRGETFLDTFDSFGPAAPAPLNALGQPSNLLFPGLLFKPVAAETFLLA